MAVSLTFRPSRTTVGETVSLRECVLEALPGPVHRIRHTVCLLDDSGEVGPAQPREIEFLDVLVGLPQCLVGCPMLVALPDEAGGLGFTFVIKPTLAGKYLVSSLWEGVGQVQNSKPAVLEVIPSEANTVPE